MAQVLGTNQAGRTGSGVFTLPLPTANGIQSVLAIIAHEGPMTVASNWTVLFDVDINGAYHYNTMSGNFGIAFCVANIANSPGTTWNFTQLYPNFVCAGIVIGYDGEFLDSAIIESTLGTAVSPAITTPGDWQVIRAFFDAGESTYVNYPNSGSLFDSYQFRQVASGAAALVAVTHEESPGGSTPSYDEAEWTLPLTPEGSTGFTLSIQFGAPPGPQPSAPNITTSTLSTAYTNEAFSQTLIATGNTPITWSIQSGSLPAGLSLNPTTGLINGTSIGYEMGSVTIRATNTEGFDEQEFSWVSQFPEEEAGRTAGLTTTQGTPYYRVPLTIMGDPAVVYLPRGVPLHTNINLMVVAHGAEDDETFIDGHPFATVEHCLDRGMIMICPYASGNQFGNDTARFNYDYAINWAWLLWTFSDIVWYGFSMGAHAGLILNLRSGGVLNDTWGFAGFVFIDLPWDMLWHWNNGSGWEHGLIVNAYGGYDAAYDPATYSPSTYAGVRAFVSYSPDDTVAVAAHDSLAMQSYTAGYANLTMYQSYGDHENPPHFAPTQVNAWLDNLIFGDGGTTNTFDRLYVGSDPADRAYLGDTLIWEG